VLVRLRLPRRTVDAVVALVGEHMRFPSLPKMRPARARRFLGREDFPLHLALHAADSGASHGDLSLVEHCRRALASYADDAVLPPPLLRGGDLLAVGYPPGPLLGRILRWVRDEQLEGRLETAADAVRRVRDRFPVPGSEV